MGRNYSVGNGRKTAFWQDVWVTKYSLQTLFPFIFRSYEQQNWTVAQVVQPSGFLLTFSRSFGPVEKVEWTELNNMLGNVVLTGEEAVVKRDLEKKGRFTTKSLYRFILDPGVCDVRMDIWKSSCPLK